MRPGPLMPFMTRDGVADAPMEPGARLLCEPWDLGPEAKLWRLIVPWKPLPLRRRRLDGLADREGRDGHGLTDHQFRGLVAELHERAHGGRVDLLEMAEQRFVERFLTHRPEAELHGFIAVDFVGADRGHRAWARLEHGDALDTTVVEESLGHTQLLGEDGGHSGSDDRGGVEGLHACHQLKASRISMSTPAGRWSSRWSESTVLGVGW